uniref:ATP synthase complex subunit 8 n=1 Tax=Heterandria formosa TaxID=55104 RepID=K9MRV8_9TELE|nr:ATP synthase F0 subunit 8 [Heterandria formosa]
MPQLTPSPWPLTLLFSWVILSVIVLPKVSAHVLQENPTPQDKKKLQTEPWNWPWH